MNVFELEGKWRDLIHDALDDLNGMVYPDQSFCKIEDAIDAMEDIEEYAHDSAIELREVLEQYD